MMRPGLDFPFPHLVTPLLLIYVVARLFTPCQRLPESQAAAIAAW